MAWTELSNSNLTISSIEKLNNRFYCEPCNVLEDIVTLERGDVHVSIVSTGPLLPTMKVLLDLTKLGLHTSASPIEIRTDYPLC